MDGFYLLCAHLLGDYILQNDWMAKWKTVWKGNDDQIGRKEEWIGHVACTLHCVLYTAAVTVASWWWMPWHALLGVFLLHWFIDRYRFARWWMLHVSGQAEFAVGPLSPWSIIAVDNTFHLLTLAWFAMAYYP